MRPSVPLSARLRPFGVFECWGLGDALGDPCGALARCPASARNSSFRDAPIGGGTGLGVGVACREVAGGVNACGARGGVALGPGAVVIPAGESAGATGGVAFGAAGLAGEPEFLGGDGGKVKLGLPVGGVFGVAEVPAAGPALVGVFCAEACCGVEAVVGCCAGAGVWSSRDTRFCFQRACSTDPAKNCRMNLAIAGASSG